MERLPQELFLQTAVAMSPRSAATHLGRLCFVAILLVCVSGEKVSEKPPETLEELGEALGDLAGEARSYLGRLTGEQILVSVQKAFTQVLGVVAGAFAGGVNVLLLYTSSFLQVVGIPVRLPPNKVTAEGVIFVVQWLIAALIGYWLISLVLRLVTTTLKQTLWLLKAALALACFSLILSDHRVGTETMAIRLAALVCVCILLGIGPSVSRTVDKTAHLEEQLKILERRLRDIERWTEG